MREILFRGKRVDNGEWVEGYYVNSIGPDCEPNETRHYIVTYPGDWHEVYTSTVGQYTGITDRKGNRIFEGDVIRFSLKTETTDYVVEWCDGGFVFRDVKIRAMGGDLVQSDADNAEIVRNIHDNADLVK